MARMSEQTVHYLRVAVADPELVGRYWSHVKIGRPDECWLWTGPISGKGHGRFQIADAHFPQPDGSIRRRTYVVIAHRFGYAALHGVDALLQVPLLAHQCDNPLVRREALVDRVEVRDLHRRPVAAGRSKLGAA